MSNLNPSDLLSAVNWALCLTHTGGGQSGPLRALLVLQMAKLVNQRTVGFRACLSRA